MNITYTKIITENRTCPFCMGQGKLWHKEYHNQLVQRKCYMCDGKGKRVATWAEDATNEVADLRRALEETTQQLHEEMHKVFRLQAGLKLEISET